MEWRKSGIPFDSLVLGSGRIRVIICSFGRVGHRKHDLICPRRTLGLAALQIEAMSGLSVLIAESCQSAVYPFAVKFFLADRLLSVRFCDGPAAKPAAWE